MKSSLIVFTCFVAGLLIGFISQVDFQILNDLSMWLLYLLMFIVGISIGADRRLTEMIRKTNMRDILYPIVTIVGTLILTLSITPFLNQLSVGDCLAINSACGYYSLSSILLPELSTSTTLISAVEIGSIALLSNVLREILSLSCMPTITKRFGPRSAISSAGVTSVDVCLPAIARCCGEKYVAPAILHGTIIDISVPWLIAVFTSI